MRNPQFYVSGKRPVRNQLTQHNRPCRNNSTYKLVNAAIKIFAVLRLHTTLRTATACSLFLQLHGVFLQLNILRSIQNGHQFAEDILRCIFVNEKYPILIKISLKFVPKGPIDNNPALV